MYLKDIIKNTLGEEMSYSSQDNYDSFRYDYDINFYDEDNYEEIIETLANDSTIKNINNKKKEVIEMNNTSVNNKTTQNNLEGSVNMNNNNNEMMMAMMAQMQQMMEANAKLQAQVNELLAQKVAPVTPVVDKTPVSVTATTTPKASVGTQESRVEADNYNNSKDRSDYAHTRVVDDMRDVDWRELQRTNQDAIDGMLDDLRTSILTSLNPNYYDEVLDACRIELLQAYYMRLLIVAGQYHPENDNLDSLSRAELTEAIKDIEIANWLDRQVAKGKNPYASSKQLELLKKNNIDTTNVKYWWQASSLLETIFGSYDNNPTAKQISLIKELVIKLELQGYDMTVTTKKEASAKIDELNKLHDEKFGVKPATEAQKEMYKRYLKMNNKRVTKKVEEMLASVGMNDLSKLIDTERKTYNEEHPECSEGQANYIKSLCDQLMVACDLEAVRELTKVEATNKIDELSRQLLYRKMRRTVVSITMEEINKLSRDEVKVKLDEFRKQR